MIRFRTFAAGLALALTAASPSVAHHSFAMFDRSHSVTLEGTVKELQWTNPHVWIQVIVPDGQGGEDEWGVECTSVNFMSRMGWTRDTLKPGDKVKLTVYPLKDGSHGGQFGKLTEVNGGPVNFQGYR